MDTDDGLPADAEPNGSLTYTGDTTDGTMVLSTATKIFGRGRTASAWGDWTPLGGGSIDHASLTGLDTEMQHPLKVSYDPDSGLLLDEILDNKSNTDHTHDGYATDEELNSHISDTSNPHQVTATQVGSPSGSWTFDGTTLNITVS
jgi:hypothetical protein